MGKGVSSLLTHKTLTQGAMEVKRWIMDGRVLLGMLVVQVIATGLQILSRVILSEGTFVFALMAYRHVVAAFSVAPFALYFERFIN